MNVTHNTMPTPPTIRSALLLLGPTGAGKTPLGDLIARQGLWGHGWAHFDFGHQMRRIVASSRPSGPITQADVDFLHHVLHSGALLENEQFPLARRIFQSFLDRGSAGPGAWIVLNGLPRHLGQAEALESLVQVRAVAQLDCTPEVVAARIHTNVGGDRTGRNDDHATAVERKLEIYRARTEELLNYYRRRGVPILRVEVTAEMTPRQMLDQLAAPPV
jgi:adenylate kinase